MRRESIPEVPGEITEPARAESTAALLEFTGGHAWECGFQDRVIDKIKLAMEEVFQNILHFACKDGLGEITVSCTTDNSGALVVTVADTGIPFNMLLASTFPEAADFSEEGEKPSTKVMKRIIKNIEYKREANRNVMIFIISRDVAGSH